MKEKTIKKQKIIKIFNYLSKNFFKYLFAMKRKIADKIITITAILAPDKPCV